MSSFVKTGPKISIIIPVYNGEDRLKKCLNSIIQQTYKNFEVVLVNDGSKDKSIKIIQKYIKHDKRIKLVNHDENFGLLQSRITGFKNSSGEYIAFVDCDDTVSIDWFRLLIKKATTENADITIGDFCNQINKKYYYYNLDPIRVKNYYLTGKEVFSAFVKNELKFYSWHVIWNKLYSRRVWELALPDLIAFSNKYPKFNMWEDVVFSSTLWFYAKKAVNIHNAYYYYYKSNLSALTSSANKSKENTIKYLHSVKIALDYLKATINKTGKKEFIQNYLNCFNRAYEIIYFHLFNKYSRKRFSKEFASVFGSCSKPLVRNDYLYSRCTELKSTFFKLEKIKKTIVSNKTRLVSFDIFDTLVVRPFFEPSDLFNLLSLKLYESSPSFVDFKIIRKEAEQQCRIDAKKNNREEINLDEIYDYITNTTSYSKELLQSVKNEEINLEIRLTKERKIGKELYQLAVDSGKQIIAISDMYLNLDTINKILSNSGYSISKVFLSSELNVTKSTGNLYKYVVNSFNTKNKSEIIHIGDDFDSDFKMPCSLGIKSAVIPKPIDILTNENSICYSSNAFKKMLKGLPTRADHLRLFDSFFLNRSIFAIIANKLYDNPFFSPNISSDFNSDPYLLGYYALGPYLLGIANWINQQRTKHHINCVHFVARDGYLVKIAFNELFNSLNTSNYLRVSRQSLLLADIKNPEDLYSLGLKLNIYEMSPETVIDYLKPIILNIEKIKEMIKRDAYSLKFSKYSEYEIFIKSLISNNVITQSSISNYQKILHEYFFKIVHKGDWIFDIGYSGRTESSLSYLLGFPVGSLYIHKNSDVANIRENRFNCPSECFYSYKPLITGHIREHLIMELGPSTICYKKEKHDTLPVFGDYEYDYISEFITKTIQEASIDFIKDFKNTFKNLISYDLLSNDYAASILEFYLNDSNPFDHGIFSAIKFEDRLSLGKTCSLEEFWEEDLSFNGLTNFGSQPSYLRALIKICNKLIKIFPAGTRRRKFAKKVGKFSYNFLRKIYRLFNKKRNKSYMNC